MRYFPRFRLTDPLNWLGLLIGLSLSAGVYALSQPSTGHNGLPCHAITRITPAP